MYHVYCVTNLPYVSCMPIFICHVHMPCSYANLLHISRMPPHAKDATNLTPLFLPLKPFKSAQNKNIFPNTSPDSIRRLRVETPVKLDLLLRTFIPFPNSQPSVCLIVELYICLPFMSPMKKKKNVDTVLHVVRVVIH